MELDLSKAFDTVDHSVLRVAFHDMCLPQCVVELLLQVVVTLVGASVTCAVAPFSLRYLHTATRLAVVGGLHQLTNSSTCS